MSKVLFYCMNCEEVGSITYPMMYYQICRCGGRMVPMNTIPPKENQEYLDVRTGDKYIFLKELLEDFKVSRGSSVVFNISRDKEARISNINYRFYFGEVEDATKKGKENEEGDK